MKNSNSSNYKKSKMKGGDLTGDSSFDHIQPVQAKPLEVKVYNNFEMALKAFRAIVQKERILSTFKDKQRYEKPSDKKRRKRNESRRKVLELENPYQVAPKSKE